MKIYILTAQEIQNGTRINATQREVLGDYNGRRFLTEESAEDARSQAQEDAREFLPGVIVEVILSDETDLVAGQRYDEQSVRDAGYSCDDPGYQTADYFDASGRYIGEDVDGIGLIAPRANSINFQS